MPTAVILRALCSFLLFAALSAAAPPAKISLNDKEYFEAPGFSFLLFHNNYQVGYQGGLQMIQQGERLLDAGDLLLAPKTGVPAPQFQVKRRTVDRANSSATVFAQAGDAGGYQLLCRTDGTKIFITLTLDKSLDWSRYEQAALKFAIYPGAYMLKSYQADTTGGVFPRQYTGQRVLVDSTNKLLLSPEDPAQSILLARAGGTLRLTDNRVGSPSPWFLVTAPLTPGTAETKVEVTITPTIDTAWRRPPVIGISQAGYHPAQAKQAVLELDPRDPEATPVTLYRLSLEGGRHAVKKAAAKPWGKFLRYRYEIFDFSDIKQPGNYQVEARGITAGPFQIDPAIYQQAWKPTLQYFMPVQMCHVAVKEGVRTWHGACHVDDARQAPANFVYLDGYQQAARETRFADDEHIPGLDWGGWHDAGDLDLPAGSLATTTLYLALAQEEFRPSLDETTVNREQREVRLHVADGKQDLLQQVEYGVEGMLGSYRTAGHIFPGIIERNRAGYGHLGDPAAVTDNRVDSGAKGADDRWAFTNRNTGLQYLTAQSLAVASRVLKETNPALASECLKTAQTLYESEQQRPPVYAVSAYTPRDSSFRSQEITAAAELLITTGDRRYSARLQTLLPEMRKATPSQMAAGPGWTLVRALPSLPDGELKAAVLDFAKKWKTEAAALAAANPYGVRFPEAISKPDYRLEDRSGIHSGFVWGPGWNLQADAVRQYYLNKHLPELFDIEPLLAVVNFVLGCHPASNMSYVSGVGANSALVAFGINRAEWSHIPGGVISGASLIKPDLMELKEFPFLWYQTEYVIGGAASYIFDVLAADRLLNKPR
jgi:hypothetical protein